MCVASPTASIAKGDAVAAAFARKLRRYLHGFNFTVETDHKPLRALFAKRHTGQLVRWALAMSEFSYQIAYKKDVHVADLLSRDPRWVEAPDTDHRVDPCDLVSLVELTTAPAHLQHHIAQFQTAGAIDCTPLPRPRGHPAAQGHAPQPRRTHRSRPITDLGPAEGTLEVLAASA